ncbi:MAG TPA: hypothetical protein VHL58_16435 [Thermoanaerobaculia bacterium]|nr:hypothetical protein [Thermoanaerobaculia bacterium]
MATSVWKARRRLRDNVSGELQDELRRVSRHLESAMEAMRELGLEVKDHTGQAFDYGLLLKVVATQRTPGIYKEYVIETIRPTIYWQEQIVQIGEVVIATPDGTESGS